MLGCLGKLSPFGVYLFRHHFPETVQMIRHEVIGYQLHETVEDTRRLMVGSRDKLLKRLSQKPLKRVDDDGELIDWAVKQAVFSHLGFEPVEPVGSILRDGFERAKSFFSGDWWVGNEDACYVLDRKSDYPVQAWYTQFRNALLLADWSDSWDEVKAIRDWVNDDVALGIAHNDPWLNYSLLVESKLNTPLFNHGELVEAVAKGGHKYERELYSVCRAIAELDSEQFAKAVSATVKTFCRSMREDVPNVTYWVSLDLSHLWSLASRSGLALPRLSPIEDATIVRRDSVLQLAT